MHDVAIVGAGPVGLMLAALLAKEGADVCVLERRPHPSGHSRAIGIHPPSMDALASVGVADSVLDECVRIRSGVVRSGGRTLGTLSLAGVSPRHPFIVTLPQHRSEALLERRLGELAPGALRRGVDVMRLREAGDRAILDCERPAGPQPVEARFVVAADGARSRLRAAAGIESPRRSYGGAYLMGDFADDTDDDTSAVVYLEADGVVESFPLPGSLRRWVVRTSTLESGASATDLVDLVRTRTGTHVNASSNSMISGFTVQRQLPARLVHGRLVLVGDAAHEVSPIGGQGMNLGWLDAVDLAPRLLAAIEAPGNDRAAASLREYDACRRRSARRAARLSEINMALGRPARGLTLAGRNLLLGSVLRSPLSRLLAQAFSMRWS